MAGGEYFSRRFRFETDSPLLTYPQNSRSETVAAHLLRRSFSFTRLNPKLLIHMERLTAQGESSRGCSGDDKPVRFALLELSPQSYPQIFLLRSAN